MEVRKSNSLILFLRYFIGFSLSVRFSVGLSTFTSPTLVTLVADKFDNSEESKLSRPYCFPNL